MFLNPSGYITQYYLAKSAAVSKKDAIEEWLRIFHHLVCWSLGSPRCHLLKVRFWVFELLYFGTFLGELHCPRGDWPMERKSTLRRVFVLDTIPLIMLKSFKIVHNSPNSWLGCRNTASNESWEGALRDSSVRKPSSPTPTGSGRA